MSLKLSKSILNTVQKSAAHSDDRLKSDGQKNAFFGHFGQHVRKGSFLLITFELVIGLNVR
jgi:hypothetical protein